MLKLPQSTSAGLSIDLTDIKKVVRLSAVGAIGVFLSQLATSIPALDFGDYQPFANLIGIVLTELARRFVTDNTAA